MAPQTERDQIMMGGLFLEDLLSKKVGHNMLNEEQIYSSVINVLNRLQAKTKQLNTTRYGNNVVTASDIVDFIEIKREAFQALEDAEKAWTDPLSKHARLILRLHEAYKTACVLSGKRGKAVSWCHEQFGDDVLMINNVKRTSSRDAGIRRLLRDPDVDFSAARWACYGNTFYFKNEADAIIFKLSWPCRMKNNG